MNSEPEGGSSSNIQPETSNDLIPSEEVKPLKTGDKEIGKRDFAKIDDSPTLENKEIGQGDVVSPPTVIVSSPNTQEISDDLEVILDSADDDESLHLKWDDDEEIEEDIISLDIPASPPKDNHDKLVALTEKDKEHFDEDVCDDINKVTNPEPIDVDPTLESMQLDIDNICAEIKNNIDEIDEFENETNNEDINDIAQKTLCPTVTDDLILIEDDDNIEDVIPAPEAEKITNNEDNIERDMSYEDHVENNDKLILKVDNSKNVDDTLEKNTAIDVQDKMKINLVKYVSERPKDIITDVINSQIETIADKTTEIEMEVDNSTNIPVDDKSTVNKKGIVTSSPNESLSDASAIDPNQDHGLIKPDMMLEIPTQEIINFLDDTDVSNDLNQSNETAEKINIEDEVTDNDISSVTKENNIESTADSKLSPNAKYVEDKIEISDTAKITKDQEETKEKGEAMDVTEDIKETKTDTTPEHAASNVEVVKYVIPDEEKSTTKLQETDKPEITASNDKTVNSVTAEEPNTELQDIDKSLNTASKTEIPEKPINNPESLTFVVPLLETDIPKTPVIEQSTSFNFVVPTLTETTNTESKNVTNEEKPSTSKDIIPVSSIEQQPSSNDISERNSQAIELGTKSCDTKVKRSQEMEGTKNELQEVTDSLGLLAESTRSMEDDEEPEDEEDEDDDFDQDESSNQMTAEHSEDSNAQQSETDGPKDQDEKGTDSPQEEKEGFTFAISNIVTDAAEKDGEDKGDVQDKEGDMQDKDGDVDVDEIEDEVEVTPEIIGDISAIDESEVTAADDIGTVETQNKPSQEKQATDVETVKLSDTSDSEVDGSSLLRNMLAMPSKEPPPTEKTTPVKKLAITQMSSSSFNFVDLEESSSEDDVQVVSKKESTPPVVETSSIDLKDVAAVAADIPKTPNKTRTPRINTSEISIRTISSAEAATLPQIQPPEERQAPKLGLEVFSLDSDEEDATKPADPLQEPQKPRVKHKCINLSCKSTGSSGFLKADAATIAYYDAARKKRTMVCEECANAVLRRTQSLVDGIKEFTPLLHLDIVKLSTELVEISDSESEDEADVIEEVKEKELIGEKGVKFLEEHLADMINQTWKKFKMDDRLTEAQDMLNGELKMLEEQSKEIDTMLNECQLATDILRKELYATFEHDRQELTPLIIVDTPGNKTSYLETDIQAETTPSAKRRMSSGNETPAKRPHTEPIPLGYAPIDNKDAAKDNTNAQDKTTPSDTSKLDDDKDISVLQVSAEAAPPSLPPPGPLARAPLRAGALVYGMRNVFGSWLRGRILEVQGKTTVPGSTHMFTICKVKFEGKARNPVKLLPGRCLAYSEPTEVRMTIGTRVIALFKDTNDNKRDSFYSGIISEVPNPVNKYRYLIFFDDGYAQYVRHADTRLVCECAPLVWEEVHPFSREFVREYLMAYPERPMVRLHAGQSLKTEWNGKWWSSRVTKVDASLAQVHFEEDNRTEWIYRGSTRLAPLYLELQAAERHRARPMPRTKAQPRINMPYVEYTRSDLSDKTEEQTQSSPTVEQQRETRQRAVAKKSTTPAPAPAPAPSPAPAPAPPAENVTSRVVYYTPKNAVKPHKMSPHSCGAQCRRSDVLALKDLRTYNPLAKPLLSGWERQIVRFKGHKEVMYRAPCGRRLRNMRELHRYLRAVHSDMAVDLFDFAPGTHCLAEFVLNSCLVGKKDLSHGKENVPVPCVNYYDESLPEFCSYNTERTPTAGVPLNLDPDFLCGCDCTDDCEDKSKCGCWRMTLEGARTIGLEGNVGYVYRRLPEPLPTGIYECNSRCKCKQTCLNRVAQHPLQLKLQVFKTLNRGWGIRALNDVPKGSFLCVYAGNLLTDATANMDGLNEGDEYLAELDYIEVVEQMKEGFEEDIPDADKRLDKKNQAKQSDDSSEEMSSSEEEDTTQDDREDDDFRPDPGEPIRIMEFSKRLRKRDKKKQKEEAKEKEKEKEAPPRTDDDCITISDDEEVREPSHFMAQPGMASNPFKSKYRSVRSYFGKDEACYIVDAKVQGNIGRYLNHSCTPNVFVQNVFVDTHDPRFPWVAFFALCHIKAGTELTWNYNYDVGSVPGKVLYCYCGAHNCRGRLL